MVNLNMPVYSFLGFNLLKCDFTRISKETVSKFSLKLKGNEYDEDKRIYSIGIQVILKYGKDEQSNFLFNAGFKINDDEWKRSMKDKELNQLFLSVVFPFVRKMISDITDDSRGSFIIPIIDLRNIDLDKGLSFINTSK